MKATRRRTCGGKLAVACRRSRKGTEIPSPARVWLGAPHSIKGLTEAIFSPRKAQANLLVVGLQSDERVLTILSVALISLAAQYPKDGAKFFMSFTRFIGVDFRNGNFSSMSSRLFRNLSFKAATGNLAEVMGALSAELKRCLENGTGGPEIFVLVHDLQNFKKLRQEDELGSFSSSPAESSPAATLLELITEGLARGIHVILTCDSYGKPEPFSRAQGAGRS